MVTGSFKEKPELLSKDWILSKISQYDIFRRILGVDFKLGVPFCNPLRGEDNPSAIIRSYSGKLVMKDYVEEKYNGDCFQLVGLVNGCNFYESLETIAKDFSLEDTNKKAQIITWKQPDLKEFEPPFFQIITRAPTQEELKYWELHHQGLSDLKEENIFFPETIYRNRTKLPQSPYLTFCYWYEDVQSWKLYRPSGQTGKKVWYHKRKWDSSLPFDYIENLDKITNTKKAFIATSKKDKMVVRQALGIDNIGNIQGENISSINDENMNLIKNTTKEQYICGDNDEPGCKFSWLLTKEFGFKHVNPPYSRPKDFADWGRDFGLEEIKEHFKRKGLL